MKEQEFVFSIFTPTYNRARLLGRAFQSLREQTFRNFEWLVVDSGSDGTDKLVEHWAKEANFPVSYTWQPKNGKHIAVNTGVKMAKGDFFIILDSDDWLVPNALERLLFHWQAISELMRNGYSGVAGLCAYASGEIVGTPFPAPIIDSNAIEIRTIYNVTGDKFGMIRTDVLRTFPFPEDLGSFVTESLIWNRIAKVYNERYINEVLAHKEYQTDGLSYNSIKIRAESSLAARTYYKEFVDLEGLHVPLDHRLKACANYVRFSIHDSVPLSKQYAEINRKAYWIFSLPFGIAIYLRDKWLLDKRIDTGVGL
ncbi:glycosyltransferase family 2 protein [Methanothrix sp.]|uniref:glycosyltransferase family 2 protein n=1 Tax=Methanothrix sp. TaxID=90426 RepID=UPI003BB5717B